MAGQLSWDESYVGKIRKAMGDMVLIVTAVRAVIFDKEGKVLLIKRSDNGVWALPAGAQELGESVTDCLRREVREETGLEVTNAEAVSIYTDPKYNYTTVYGKTYQNFTLVFRVDEWRGKLLTQTTESTDARFYPLNALPEITPQHRETIDDALNFQGRFTVK
jgi:ADP-ribose pyrophosphatase YjhB (NUDIX family)